MMKMEMLSRENAERETKSIVQNLLKSVMDDVAAIKEDVDSQVRKLSKEIGELASDNAERAHFLSRYIDEEIGKLGAKASRQIDNLKVLSAKLTEQFKKHLINHEGMKKDMLRRFDFLEKHLPVYRSELY